MRLIVITPEVATNTELMIVNQLFENGLQRLHVRKPLFTTKDYSDYLAEIDPQYYSRISLHGCFELFDELKLGGIHLNSFLRKDAHTLQQRLHIPPGAISASFHAWQEIEDSAYDFGYAFISPVFDSISKAGYKAAIDLSGAKELKQKLAGQNKYCPQIIGLGGVDAAQLKTLHDCGFDGAAMLGAIWQAENPVAVFTEAMKAINSLGGH